MAANRTGTEVDTSDADIFSILLATDCHVGYLEKDPIRGQDSFATFEEILKEAVKHNVDFILFGGDLFHENKPSRKTLHHTIHLLRKYCMGDKPCQIEFLSDQSINFSHCKTPIVNYEDPHLNISYPVFSVHGNHDDPTGEGSLSAIDLISECGLLNHFGKPASVDNIEINPLLLQKGGTKLALYGLGSVRDERLHRTFCDKKVKMLRPSDDPDSWFNLFVIHQNRAKHGTTNYIPENFLDEFLDLVVWGHEHECLIDAEWSASGKAFYVTQPGSSVATSLSPGEAKPKNVGLLKINKKNFKLDRIPLKTVRPFIIDEVVLSDTSLDPSDEEDLSIFLKQKVETMIERAQSTNNMLPLVRLRVEYSGGFSALNPHRFGQFFVNKVANTKDILLFFRKKAAKAAVNVKSEYSRDMPTLSINDADDIRMEDVIKDFLSQDDKSLQLSVLSERRMGKALREFVDKGESGAIAELVKWELGRMQEELMKRNAEEENIKELVVSFQEMKEIAIDEVKENEEIEKVLARSQGRLNRDSMHDNSSDDDMNIGNEAVASIRGGTRGPRGSGNESTRGRRARGSRGTRGGRGGRGGGRGGGAQKNTLSLDSFLSVEKPSKKRLKQDDDLDDQDDSLRDTASYLSSFSSRSRSRNILQNDIEESEDGSDPFSVPASKGRRR